jgi:hypothetical protein
MIGSPRRKTHWVVGHLTTNPGIQQFLCRPQMIRGPRRNRWRHPERTVNPKKVVMGEVEPPFTAYVPVSSPALQ